MQDKTILYEVKVDRFSKRLIKVFYPHIIIPVFFLFLPFLNKNFYNPITGIWATMILLIIIDMLVSSYKWTLSQVVSITLYDNLFEIGIVTKNRTRVYKIDKDNIRTTLQWKGGRMNLLKLTLFDKNSIIAEFYSGGR